MKKPAFVAAVVFTFILCFPSCEKDNGSGPGSGNGGSSQKKTLSITPIAQLNKGTAEVNSHADIASRSFLSMDFRSYIELGQGVTGNNSPNYARIVKLSDGSYILFNQYGDGNSNGFDVHYSLSPDLVNWTYGGYLFKRSDYFTGSLGTQDITLYTNGNGIVLANGDLLAVASYRNARTYNYLQYKNEHGIVIKRSTDNGKTWGQPQQIYHGPNWEAHLLQLPSGELHCYFSESRPWISGSNSGTSLVVSNDNGATWTPEPGQTPRRVIRQQWYNQDKKMTLYTDQMPVIVRLNGGKKLAAVLESAVSCVNENTTFNISFAWSDDEGNWTDLVGDNDLGPTERENNIFRGAAPFLVQFPSGETVMSYGLSSHLNMRMGDADARNFGEPFVALPGRGSWGCMYLDGSHELLAAMRDSDDANNITIAVARFILNHRIAASQRSATVDGDNKEWQNSDEALFVGEKSQAQATLRCSADATNVYFLVEVLDEALSKDDNISIFLAPAKEGNKLDSEARRFRVSPEGLKNTDHYAGGWKGADLGVTAKISYDGTISDNSDTDNGYIVEIAVPRSKLSIEKGELLVNFVLFDSQGGEDAISSTSATDTSGWISLSGL